jgi:hypothetical protein
MKKISLIIGLISLVSCKSTKHTDCDAYGLYETEKESTVVKIEHCHIEEEQYCFYSIDTIHLTR